MRQSLTPKQKKVLLAITDLTHKNGMPPTLEELRIYLKYPRISSAQRHTDALKQKGYLNSSRGLSLSSFDQKTQVPLVGNVACGNPLLAAENIEAYIPYESSKLHGNPGNYFFLRAVGDSMNKANIDDGDFVLIKKQQTADPNTRIVALIGDEATIKKFKYEAGFAVLEPESTNPDNKPIYIFENLIIQGIVKDVIKKGGD